MAAQTRLAQEEARKNLLEQQGRIRQEQAAALVEQSQISPEIGEGLARITGPEAPVPEDEELIPIGPRGASEDAIFQAAQQARLEGREPGGFTPLGGRILTPGTTVEDDERENLRRIQRSKDNAVELQSRELKKQRLASSNPLVRIDAQIEDQKRIISKLEQFVATVTRPADIANINKFIDRRTKEITRLSIRREKIDDRLRESDETVKKLEFINAQRIFKDAFKMKFLKTQQKEKRALIGLKASVENLQNGFSAAETTAIGKLVETVKTADGLFTEDELVLDPALLGLESIFTQRGVALPPDLEGIYFFEFGRDSTTRQFAPKTKEEEALQKTQEFAAGGKAVKGFPGVALDLGGTPTSTASVKQTLDELALIQVGQRVRPGDRGAPKSFPEGAALGQMVTRKSDKKEGRGWLIVEDPETGGFLYELREISRK